MKYYQNEPRFNGVYSRNNSPKLNGEAFVLKLDEYKSIETHWIALHVNGNKIIFFHSLGVEHIPVEIKKFIENKNIITNIYGIQAYDLIMRGYFCIGFIDFMLIGKCLQKFVFC